MIDTFPKWKYYVLLIIVCIGVLYSVPNIYGEDPAVQITDLKGQEITTDIINNVKNELKKNNIDFKSVKIEDGNLLIRFSDPVVQLKAVDYIKDIILINDDAKSKYSIALNLAPLTPKWLSVIGAEPMKLGLDLLGGIRFVMQVGVEDSLSRQVEGDFVDLKTTFRKDGIRYKQFQHKSDNTIFISFLNENIRNQAYQIISEKYPRYDIISDNAIYLPAVSLNLKAIALSEMRNNILSQTVATLRNRVNELGVAEAVVQRQGLDKVVIELPGIQDTARAKDLLGKTATLDLVMVDYENDVNQAVLGKKPPGTRILYDRYDRPFLVKKKVILTGESIVGASSGFDSKDHKPSVSIRLGGGGIDLFLETTRKNIGRPMAVIYRETVENKSIEKIISVATINGPLGREFSITGLTLNESRDLALMLRSGALPASLSFVEQKIIGPSLGQENIRMGIISLISGLGFVLITTVLYYSAFGLIANIALVLNLVILVAIMSMIGATLTLPGIAGIVLTLGMAVDSNVLIFERIREEFRLGVSPKASIQRGFEHAFATIVDTNLTTLIIGIILYAIGTGPVKGFAVTLSIGILTSMFTAITGSRVIINLVYNKRPLTKASIGI